MSLPAHVLLAHTILLVGIGLAMEILFVAVIDRKLHGWKLQGHTYVWMFPIYALVYPSLLYLYPRMAGLSFVWRGLLYTVLIFAVEYVSGWLLRWTTGLCPWDYSGKSRWAIQGVIRLDYAPGWFTASMVFEWFFRVLRGIY